MPLTVSKTASYISSTYDFPASKSLVYKWIMHGCEGIRLPASTIGGRYFVSEDDIEGFIKRIRKLESKPEKVELDHMQDDACYCINDLVELWKVGRDAINHWIRSGKLPAANLSFSTQRPRYRIKKSDADAFWKTRITQTQTRRRKAQTEPVKEFV